MNRISPAAGFGAGLSYISANSTAIDSGLFIDNELLWISPLAAIARELRHIAPWLVHIEARALKGSLRQMAQINGLKTIMSSSKYLIARTEARRERYAWQQRAET
jgi:hypothetical protein